MTQYASEGARRLAMERSAEDNSALLYATNALRGLVSDFSTGYHVDPHNPTPLEKLINEKISLLWKAFEQYAHSRIEATDLAVQLFERTKELEREQEKVHEQRERAEEAEALVKELEFAHTAKLDKLREVMSKDGISTKERMEALTQMLGVRRGSPSRKIPRYEEI